MDREQILEAANRFCFASDTPLSDVSHEQIHKLMADFHLSQSSEITAERDRLREWQAKVIEIWNEYEERQNQKDDLGKSIVRNLTAYLKGKGDGAKGE